MRLFIITVFLLSVQVVISQDLHMEQEEGLDSIPQSVANLIHETDHPEDLYKEPAIPCALHGKLAKLNMLESIERIYVVKTVNGCFGGNAASPMWVVALDAEEDARILLSTAAGQLKITKTYTNGYKDLLLLSETAGTYIEEKWKFNGKVYAKR